MTPRPEVGATASWRAKQTTVAEAIARIGPGRRILVGSGAAEPIGLVEGLIAHGAHLADNEIVHLLTLGPAPYVAPEMAGRFRHNAFFIGENVREAVHQGRADFTPIFLSEIPALLRSGRCPIDVALIQVSPPDRHGYVSLGVSVDIVRAAVDQAQLILAEVNSRMPRTHGDAMIHIDRVDGYVPVVRELPILAPPELDDADRELGRLVATLIPNGATLQLGIGRVPNATLEALRHHGDLGIHSEMFSDGVMHLVDAGVINGRKKTLLPRKIVASFVVGSRELYEWVDDNPAIEMRASDFTNDPAIIAQNDHLIAINSALSVDLTGQVAADSIGAKLYSGIGGQVDFVRGAVRSRGGRAIIALRSLAGETSRIQPDLALGSGVVTSRGDVHHVVTEHGIADLWGKSIRQRALALIDIAHPDHRAELLAGAKARRYVFGDQTASPHPAAFVKGTTVTLADGETITLRPVRPSDEAALSEFFYRLSARSTFSRFFHAKRYFSHTEMSRLVDTDDEHALGLLATTEDGAILGMTRYDVDERSKLGDIAFVVRDDHQRKGLGSAMMKQMMVLARERGVLGFSADVLHGNIAMMGVFSQCGVPLDSTFREGVHHVVMRFR